MKPRGLQSLSMSLCLFRSFVLNSFFKLFSYDIVNWLQTCCVNACWLTTDQVKISLILINRYLSKYLFKCDSDLRSLFKINQSERKEDAGFSADQWYVQWRSMKYNGSQKGCPSAFSGIQGCSVEMYSRIQ